MNTGYKRVSNFGFRRDCPSYLASAETVCDLLLPPETTVHEKWLPAETVRVILPPAESQQEAESHRQSLQEASYQAQQLGWKQEIADSLGGSQIWQTVSAGS